MYLFTSQHVLGSLFCELHPGPGAHPQQVNMAGVSDGDRDFDLREKLKEPHRFSYQSSHRYHHSKREGYYNDFDRPRSRYDSQTPRERKEELRKVHSGIKQRRLFTDEECKVKPYLIFT